MMLLVSIHWQRLDRCDAEGSDEGGGAAEALDADGVAVEMLDVGAAVLWLRGNSCRFSCRTWLGFISVTHISISSRRSWASRALTCCSAAGPRHIVNELMSRSLAGISAMEAKARSNISPW